MQINLTVICHTLLGFFFLYSLFDGTVSVPSSLHPLASLYETIFATKAFMLLSSLYYFICYGFLLTFKSKNGPCRGQGEPNTFNNGCLMCCSTSRYGSIHSRRRMQWLICVQSFLFSMWAFFMFKQNDNPTSLFFINVLIVVMFFTWYHIAKVYFDRCDIHIVISVSIVTFLIDYLYVIYINN